MKKLLLALTLIAIVLSKHSALAVGSDQSPTPTPTPKTTSTAAPVAHASPTPTPKAVSTAAPTVHTTTSAATPVPNAATTATIKTTVTAITPGTTVHSTPIATPAAAITPFVIQGQAGQGIPVTPVTPTPKAGETVSGGSVDQRLGGNIVIAPAGSSFTKIVVTGLPREFHAGQVIEGQLLCPKYVQDSAGIWVLGTGCVIGASAELKKHTVTRATLLGPHVQSQCPAGFRNDGDFCDKPRSGGGVTGPGYSGVCPQGWEDKGDKCLKPETLSNCAHYKRGLGMGPAFSTDNNGGQCWACPGILHHNVFTGIDDVNACAAGNDDTVVWQSAQYPEPGIAAFITPEIVRLAFANAAHVDAFLSKRAKGIDDIKQRLWDQMTNSPNDSPEFKALVFTAVLAVAANNIQDERAQNAVQIFESYIKQRRGYIDRDAIRMYNAYLDINAGKQRNAAVTGPSGALGLAPDDYLGAAYSEAVPDARGADFMKALLDLNGTSYDPSSGGGNDSAGEKLAWAAFGLNSIDAVDKIHSFLDERGIIKGIEAFDSVGFQGVLLGAALVSSALEVAEGAMTLTEQTEAEKKYNELNDEIGTNVSIAEILKSGSNEEKSKLVMWWALATSPYRASDTVNQYPLKNADVCATYPEQCGYIKINVAKAHPTPQIMKANIAPAPAAFTEQVNATTALAKLLATVNSAATATAINSSVSETVSRVNKAAAAAKTMSATDLAAANQHQSELDSANIQVRNQLTRIKGISGAYPILQTALAPLPAALRGGPMNE